mmetsp:Transcript_132772/g.234919  ORF Transcript_132772/g.234919 Transcript_132772/m.234919 type:complete len:195 (+) Transcript_132772:77-661(+)
MRAMLPLLLCLACVAQARTVQKASPQQAESLVKLLVSRNPSAAFNPFASGVRPSRAAAPVARARPSVPSMSMKTSEEKKLQQQLLGGAVAAALALAPLAASAAIAPTTQIIPGFTVAKAVTMISSNLFVLITMQVDGKGLLYGKDMTLRERHDDMVEYLGLTWMLSGCSLGHIIGMILIISFDAAQVPGFGYPY